MKKYLPLVILFLSISKLSANKDLPWLKVNNTHIEDANGNRVILRGVNLGSWLVTEMWMLPFKIESSKKPELGKIKDDASLWLVFEKRFGTEKMQEIRAAFRKVWITEKDFAKIAAMGFNCVRIPFLYDMIEDESDGFFWLDWAIDAAKKQGLYVILDLHGAHGRQSNNDHTGQSGRNQFFKEPAFWEKSAKLWQKIAERYKDRPEVAGFDLLNEPQGAPNNKLLYEVQDKLYRRIRRVDSRHLIFIEDGYKGITHMPHKKIYKWENAVMSTHVYCQDKDNISSFFEERVQEASMEYKAHKMPYFMGEFNARPHGKLEHMKNFLSHLHTMRIAYCFWSYKIATRSGGYSQWGLYVGGRHVQTIDPFTDSAKEILKKIRRLNTENCSKNKELIQLFRDKLWPHQ